MVQAGGLDVEHFLDLDLEASRDSKIGAVMRHIGIEHGSGHLDAAALGQHDARHAVAVPDLVAQADRRVRAVFGHGPAEARQRVALADERSAGAEPLHVAGDVQDVRDIARRVEQAARPPVLGIGLAEAVAQGYLPVLPP